MGTRALYFNSNVITISLAGLANGNFATSSAVDNSSNLFMVVDIQITLKTGSGIPVFPNRPTVALFLLRSVDGGITFDDANDNAQMIDVFQTKNDATSYTFTADTSNIGQLPDFWKLAIKNKTGVAFDSTPANFNVIYTGKKLESLPIGV